MTPKQRKILVTQNDVKVVDIAKRCNVEPTLVYLVRSNRSRSSDVETAIAGACDVTLTVMSPCSLHPPIRGLTERRIQ